MSKRISAPEALLYVMVTMSAADRNITDEELRSIDAMISALPVFEGFERSQLSAIANAVTDFLQHEDGIDQILALVVNNLPARLKDTAYALAVELAASDFVAKQEELRFLELLHDALGLDSLIVAAIEASARARYRRQ